MALWDPCQMTSWCLEVSEAAVGDKDNPITWATSKIWVAKGILRMDISFLPTFQLILHHYWVIYPYSYFVYNFINAYRVPLVSEIIP